MDKQRLSGFSEEKLILLAKAAGDAASYGELVRRHEPSLRVFVSKLCRGADAVDDISQNAMVQGFRHIQQFRGDASFKTWLFKIAYREHLKIIRKQQSEDRLVDQLYEDEQERERTPQDGNIRMDLEAALLHVSEAERAAILLCDAFGFSHGEAAETLDAPLGTVKSHILRGRAKMRDFLKEANANE